MKINSIKLVQFRNHRSSALELDRLNVVTGRNAAGKSSLVYALEVALTGRCAATDRGGRGLDDLVTLGEKTAIVELDVDGLGTITRTIDPKGSNLRVAGWDGSLKMQQELLYEHLEADADLIGNLLNVSNFTMMSSKEQQAMLFSLAGVALSAEALADQMGERLWAALSAEWPVPEQVSPDDLDAAYRAAYGARTAAKKEAAAAEARLEALSEDAAPAGLPSPEELPAIRAQLAEAESRRDALLKQITSGQHASQRLGELASRRGTLEKRLAELGDTSYPTDDIEGLTAQLEEAMAAQDKAVAAAAEIAGKIRGSDEAIKAIKKATAKCPLAPEHVKCPLSKDDRKDLADKLTIARTKMVAEHEAAIKDQTSCAAAVSELDGKVREIRAGAAAVEKYSEVRADLDELEREARGLQVKDTSALEAEAEELAGRIGRGHELLAQVGRYAGTAEREDAARDGWKEATARVADMESLVTLLGPGPEGIKAALLLTVITDLSLRVSANLQELTDGSYRVAITTDPEFAILVDNGHTCVEPKHLSTSERFRVGIAFAVELARMSRLGLLVIDDAEVLDSANRALLSGYLDSLTDFETVILLATRDEAPAMNPVPGMTFWWVEDGDAERLELEVVEV